jgi:hypothetical protein
MKLRPVGQFAVAAALLCILCGCTPSQQCGTWAFSGSTSGNPFTSSVNSAFTFNPADCGKSCNAQIDAMIQMVRVYDLTNETFVYPSSAYYARENPYGWSIDQSDGWAYAYYGLYGQPPNSEFWAVDAAVCFKSDTCQNKIAGIYFWGFSVDSSGNASQIFNAPGWTGLEAEFQTTVTAWNKWAPTSGPEAESTTPPFPVPGQPTLPSAVPLPALSDL